MKIVLYRTGVITVGVYALSMLYGPFQYQFKAYLPYQGWLFLALTAVAALTGFLVEVTPFEGRPSRLRWQYAIPLVLLGFMIYALSPLGMLIGFNLFHLRLDSWAQGVLSLLLGILIGKAVKA